MRTDKSRKKSRTGGEGKTIGASVAVALTLGVAVILAGCGSSSSTNTSASARTGNPRDCHALRLYTWEGEAPASLLKPFEHEYGVPVRVSYITSGAESVAKMAAGGDKQEDIVLDAPEAITPMQEAGVIKPFDTARIPEYEHLLSSVQKTFFLKGQTYAIAEDWGVNPFLYSTALLKTPPTSWSVLWSPKLKGQVSLWEDVSMIFVGAAVLGYDKNPEEVFHLNKEQLTAIKNKMLQLKGNVRTMWSSAGDLIQLYSTHEVGASMGWSYIYQQLKAKHEPIAEAKLSDMGAQAWTEGAALSVDISADCEAAAYAFLSSTVTPKGQALLAESTGYAPANQAAANYMSKKLIEETGIDNPKSLLGTAIFKQAVSDPQAYNQTMEEIIAGLT
jgi:putative spermidine/putrescine transport system substrate-binding protein/spermidine/putrescine transport system substrate-binding protein